MPTEGKPQQNAMDELRELVRKSVQANATLAERGADLLKEISKQNLGLPDVTNRGNEVLRRAFDQYLRMSSAYTSNLIDLGLDASQQMLDAVRGTAAVPPQQEPGGSGSGPLFDLAVGGRPGDTCQTAIMLESDQPEGFQATFTSSEVTDAAGNAVRGFKIDFDPESRLVVGKAQFVVRVTIPKRARPGAYYAMVTLEGQVRRTFRLIVDVEQAPPPEAESTEEPAGESAATSTAKKAPRRRKQD